MKIKVNKIGITAVAIAIAVPALGGGYYYALRSQDSQESPRVSATSSMSVIKSPRDGISLDSSQMSKLNYNYSQTIRRNSQTDVQNFNMYYIIDTSASRLSILPNATSTIKSFFDSIDKTKNGVVGIPYEGQEVIYPGGNLSVTQNASNFPGNVGAVRVDGLINTVKQNNSSDRQNVLVFESDFYDFFPNLEDVSGSIKPELSHVGFLNKATMQKLKENNIKVVLIGDHFPEKTFTEIEKDFSYKISSTKADGSFLDRGDILRMFVQTTVKETITSQNTAYELSLRGTSYKFSPGFLNEVRKNSNFVVESEDFIRMKVPEFNSSNGKEVPVGSLGMNISVAFSGVDVVYRSSSTQPQAVEYLSVKKGAASDRIAINFTAPVAQEQTIYVNDEIKAEDSISNVAQLPNGATYKFKEEVDVSTKGKKEATVVVTYGDGMVVEVPVIINVLPKSNVTVKYLDTDGKELKAEVKLLEQQKEGTDYKAEQLDIEGYKFLKLDEKSAQAEGKLGEEDLEVIFIYEKVIAAPNTGHHKHETAEINFTSILSVLASLTLAVVIFAKTKFRKVKF